MASFLLFGLPLRDPLPFESSFRDLSASLICYTVLSVLLHLLPLLGVPRFDPPCSPIGLPCCGFSWLFRLLSHLPPPLPLALPGFVLSRALPASLGDLFPPGGLFLLLGVFSLWRGFLLFASPLSLPGYSGWILPWVFSVYLQLSAFFLGSVFLLPGFILPLGFSSFASPCAPQYRSVCAFGFSCFFSVGLSPLALWVLVFSVFCLLGYCAVFFPSLGGLCSRLALPIPPILGAHGSSTSFRRLSLLLF